MYQKAWCNRCVHDEMQDCRVWLLHLIHNGEDAARPLLDALIPRRADGLANEGCVMFIPSVQNREAPTDPCVACGGGGVQSKSRGFCPRCAGSGKEPRV